MKHSHFKATPQFSQPSVNVDRENGIVKNVIIVEQGANKNGSYFNSQFITDLVADGNAQKQGVKSRFGHPNMCSTSLGTFIGRYKNFTEKDGKAYADLHLDPITKKTQVEGKGISMYEYIMDMAANNPDMFGNSIHIISEMFEEEVDGVKHASHTFESLIASDLVDSPAATSSLFDDSDDLGVIVTNFLDTNTEIFDAVTANPAIIEDFFSRYADYAKRKSLINFDMNFKNKLKHLFNTKDSFDVDLTLAAGGIVTVVTEGEEPKEGDIVKDSDGKPLADGDHLLADGRTLVIEGGAGAIKEIKPAAEPSTDDTEPTLTEVMQSVSNLSKEITAFATKFENSIKETQDGVELVAKTFNSQLTDLRKTIKTPKYEAPKPEQTGGKGGKDSAYDAEAAAEARERLKSKNEQK